jgi:hypothetical protein
MIRIMVIALIILNHLYHWARSALTGSRTTLSQKQLWKKS